MRLLFTQVFETKKNTVYKKDGLYRVPIRLGEDVFTKQKISAEKADSLVNSMIAFKHLIKAYKPVDFMACATSAMREAVNRNDIVKLIKKRANIELEIIDGEKEAAIIYNNHIAERLNSKGTYLYIDVGGGSTEITLISKSKIVGSQSFNLGTVRILKKKESKLEWQKLKEWVQVNTANYSSIEGIGTGGNINKIYNMSPSKNGKPVLYKNIKKIYEELISYSYEERISELGLRPDRADVIIPAAEIFLNILKWAKIKYLYVPQIGLADGIIHVLYEKQKNQN